MQSTVEPGALEVVQRPDGLADVYLRRGIEEYEEPLDGGGTQRMWRAEEMRLVGRYDVAWCDLHFDELWEQARREAMTEGERLAECEEAGEQNAQASAELGVLAADSATALDGVTQGLADVMLAVAELGQLAAAPEGGE